MQPRKTMKRRRTEPTPSGGGILCSSPAQHLQINQTEKMAWESEAAGPDYLHQELTPKQTKGHFLPPVTGQTLEPMNETLISDISDELMTEILVRLPIKSLLRCKSVSRCWLTLISSSELINYHLQKASDDSNYSNHRLLYIFDKPTDKFQQSYLHPALYPTNSHIQLAHICHPMRILPKEFPGFVGSCNGLVCIRIPNDQIFIWNPALMKYKKLPKFGRERVHHKCAGSSMSFGFGYDKSCDDYKVVGICTGCHRGTGLLVKMYSAKSHSWRRLQNFEVRGVNRRGCFANGKLHWLATDVSAGSSGSGSGGQVTSNPGKKIYSIDVCSGLFDVLELPECVNSRTWHITVLGGYLSVFFAGTYSTTHEVRAWLMKEYGADGSWIEVLSGRSTYNPKLCSLGIPVFMAREGHILVRLNGSFFGICNSEHYSHLRTTIVSPRKVDCLTQIVFVESLVWPYAFRRALKQGGNKD